MTLKENELHSKPTGCFKCGGSGHWARDCSVKSFSTSRHVDGGGESTVQSGFARGADNGTSGGDDRPGAKTPWKGEGAKDAGAAEEPAVKPPIKRRPLLTPELLLSDNGLGYLLEKMPQMVRIRGEGHEVQDLKSLLEGYVHWHSQLHPYLGFNDFVGKLEKLGATRRVRMCVRELRDKIHSGSALVVNEEVDDEEHPDKAVRGSSVQGPSGEPIESEENVEAPNDFDSTDHGIDVNEEEFEDFFRQGTTGTNDAPSSGQAPPEIQERRADSSPVRNLPTLLNEDGPLGPAALPVINEALAARMEANRLKALERAKARRASNGSV